MKTASQGRRTIAVVMNMPAETGDT